MPTCLEFEAKNVEKAVEEACRELKCSKDKIKYDVISYGSTGIFGLVGVKKARIRVTVPDEKSQAEIRKPSRYAPEQRNEAKPASEKTDKADAEALSSEQAIKDEEPEKEVISEDREPELSAGLGDETDSDEDEEYGKRPEANADYLEIGKNGLQRIVDFITTGADISVEETSDRILFYVKGGNSGVLIGKRGQTLEAIQYLVDKIVNKNTKQRVRVQVDIEGYLDSRKAKLKSLASRLSEKAKRTGRPVTVGQLNAHDRRIVHISLRDDTDVRTQSMGEGFYRKLVIFPKKSLPQKREDLFKKNRINPEGL